MKKNRTVFTVLLCAVLLGTAAFCGYKVLHMLQLYRWYSREYEKIADECVSAIDITQADGQHTDTENKKQSKESRCPVKPDFQKLQAINPDIKAWLYCPDTPINYPVTQSADNDYYLRRDLNGEYSYAGTLFADCRCDIASDPGRIILYGHNMHNGTMFGSLDAFSDEAYRRKHPVIWLITPDKSYQLTPVAGFDTQPDSFVYDLSDDTDDYLTQIQGICDFQSTAETAKAKKAVILSTCSTKYKKMRYVLVCTE